MTDHVGTDRTTKCLLALAALGLWACALRPWLGPAPAVAQDPALIKRGYSVTESSAQGRRPAPADAGPPVLCRDADSPARQPVEATRRLTGPATQFDVQSDLYKVPPGKRLVVEYLSATVHEGSSAAGYNFQVTVTQGGGQHYANFNEVPDAAPYSAVSQPVRLYADAGTTVTVDAYTSGQSATALDFTLSGYLVDMPWGLPIGCFRSGERPPTLAFNSSLRGLFSGLQPCAAMRGFHAVGR